jgi:methyl-accepting chemotaxis protein
MLEESILATQQQKSAADQVAMAMVQIRESADQLAAEQEQRVGTAERVDDLVRELERTVAGSGANDKGPE